MFKLILLFSVFYVSLASLHRDDKRPLMPLVAGAISRPKQFPFLATIYIEGKTFCGGAIISKRFIITAASCCKPSETRFRVRVGTTLLYFGGVVKGVQRKYPHPKFNGSAVNDICLLRLSSSLKYTKHVKRIKLPKSNHVIDVGTKVSTVGYGFWWPKPVPLNILDEQHYFETTTAAFNTCLPSHLNETLRKKHIICTELGYYGVEPCARSFGVPLVSKNVLLGLFTFGQGHCFFASKSGKGFLRAPDHNERIPAVYTNVVYHLKFIKKITGVITDDNVRVTVDDNVRTKS